MNSMLKKWNPIARLMSLILLASPNGIGGKLLLSCVQNQTEKPAKEGTNMNENTGFYCNLRALTTEERSRHHELTLKLEEARLETRELPNGFALRLDSQSASLGEIAEWISSESKCCPFFDFAMEQERDGGARWLKLTGKDGVKDFIRLEFKL
jgi:hypothetical protein